MRHWLFLLGGPLVWSLHFGGAYLLASVFDLRGDSGEASAPLLAFSAVCLLASLWLLGAALHGPRWLRVRGDAQLDGLWRSVGGLGGGLAAISIVWQALPAVF